MHGHDSAAYIFSALIAGTAQAMMYLNKVSRGDEFSWLEFLSAVGVSSIVGLLICLGGHSYGLDYELCGALAGLGGFLGKEAVSLAKAIIQSKAGGL